MAFQENKQIYSDESRLELRKHCVIVMLWTEIGVK